jgi:hypothetical protein
MRMTTRRHILLAGLILVSLTLPALAQQEVTIDIGTLDRDTVEQERAYTSPIWYTPAPWRVRERYEISPRTVNALPHRLELPEWEWPHDSSNAVSDR